MDPACLLLDGDDAPPICQTPVGPVGGGAADSFFSSYCASTLLLESCSRIAAALPRPAGRRIMRVAGLALAFLAFASSQTDSSMLVINEVSASGTPEFCDGDDWVEIALSTGASAAVNISGYMLCDSDGCGDTDAYTFADDTLISPGSYLAVCHTSPKNKTERRWIGPSDTITLYAANGSVIDTSGPMGGDSVYGKTWARGPDVNARRARSRAFHTRAP